MTIAIVAYYMKVKQQHIIKQLVRLPADSPGKSYYPKMIQLNREYGRLMFEIDDYNPWMGRALDATFIYYIFIMCYLIYLLVYADIMLPLKCLFSSVISAHFTSLNYLILSCASVTGGTTRMAEEMRKLYRRNDTGPKDAIRYQLKVSVKLLPILTCVDF